MAIKILQIALVGAVIVAVGLGITVFLLKAPVRRPANRPTPVVPADRVAIREHLQTLTAIFPRSTSHPENLGRAADFLRKTFEGYGLKVREQRFKISINPTPDYVNLIVDIPAADGSMENPIVIGGHYDAIEATYGADDNGTGAVGVLELARLLSKKPPAVPVELVAFTNEERPCFSSMDQGAMQHARALRDARQKIRLMISLEMIGYFTDEPNTQTFPVPFLDWLYPTRGNFITFASLIGQWPLLRHTKQRFALASDFPVESFVGPASVKGLLASDHAAYLQMGFPALMITDTAYYRNHNYHQLTDTVETLNIDAMARVLEGVHGMLVNWN